MGLDQYLEGRKYLWQSFDKPDDDRKEDGFRISMVTVDLGYWRKHPDLHGYIVKQFAGGKDECQEIELTAENIHQIMTAIRDGALPHTEGFFFGNSYKSDEQKSHDLLIFDKAAVWLAETVRPKPLEKVAGGPGEGFAMYSVPLDKPFPRETRSVVYRASW